MGVLIMAKLTKAQSHKLHDLQMMVFAMSDRVFSAIERSDVPFSECLKAATPDVREAHGKARAALSAFEFDMARQGRGYFDTYGNFKGNN
jgi:hypothetical protein